jgi:PAS domain S-box-containing protein
VHLDPRIDGHSAVLKAAQAGTHPDDAAAARLARALAALSACNKAVAAAASEPDLLERACEAIVQAGRYPFAWVGYARSDPEEPVQPVAQFGLEQVPVEPASIDWRKGGLCFAPTDAAIRTGGAQVARRGGIEADAGTEPAEMHGRACRSCVALPLLVEGECLGALTLYDFEPEAFDDGEVLMLGQVAEDLALGIARQRADAGRLHAESEQKKTAAALRVQTALLDQLFESAAEAIVLLDLDDRIIRINREFTGMFGYTADECAGRPLNDLIVPAARLGEARRLTLEVGQGKQCNAESVRRRKDGSTLHVSILGAPITSGELQIASYAIYRDISERRRIERMQARRAQEAALRADIQAIFAHPAGRTEEALQRTAEVLARQLEHALVRIWTFDGSSPPLEVHASSGTDGRSQAGRSLIDPDSTLIAAVARDRVAYVSNDRPAGTQAGLAHGMATIAGYPLLIDAALAGVLGVYAPQPLEPDTLETLESIAGTISQCIARQRAQEALQASEERFRAIVDQQTDLICRFRPDTTLTFVNEAYARHFGRPVDELLGRSFLEFIPERQRAGARAHVESLCADPRVVAYEHAALSADGKLRWHQWIDQLVPDAHGRSMEFQSVGRDVTERRQAEEALLRSEQIARAQAAVITATLQSITREPTLDSFIGQLLRTTVEQLGGIAGTFWVPADTRDSVRAYLDLEDDRLVRGEDSDHPGRDPQRITHPQGGSAAQLDDPKVFDFEFISTHPAYAPFREWAQRRGVRTVLQVPMVFGDQLVGLYTVRFDHERSFGPEDLQLAKALALQATLAIRLTQLGEQARRAAVAAEGERVARDKAAELDAVNAALRAEIVERRRAEQLARAHSSAITGTLRSLTVEPKLDVFIGQVLKAIADELGAVSGAFWIRDPATDLLHLQFNYERGELTRQGTAREPWQLPRRAPPVDAGRNDPAVVTYSDADIDTSPALAPLRRYLRANGIRHVIAVRLFFAGQFFGTFSARFLDPEPLAQDQINLALALAQEATLAIALARLEGQAREAATATERERAARERAAELAQCNAVLQSSLQALASQPRQELFLAHVLETIGATLDAHSCVLWRLSSDSVWLALAVSGGKPMGPDEVSTSPVARAFVRAVAAEPALLRLMARPTAYVIEDLATTDLYPEPVKQALLQLGVRSLTSMPVRIGDQVLGRFEVRLDRNGTLLLHDLEILEALANQVALALHMTRLADESRQAAVFAERNRLARDIHDTLAQGFTGVIVQLEAAKDAIGHRRRRESDDHIERAADLARHSLAEARRSVHALRPLALESGGVGPVLERLLVTMTAGTGIDARFDTVGAGRKLPPEWEENLLRIGQEALANALKHANPRRIQVELRFDPERICLSLRDDGAGFDPAAPSSGMGLSGMRERAARLGWRLEVRSRIGEGSEVFVGLRPPD